VKNATIHYAKFDKPWIWNTDGAQNTEVLHTRSGAGNTHVHVYLQGQNCSQCLEVMQIHYNGRE